MNDWVIDLINGSGYLGIGFLMFLETVFPPIPSEVIMPVAGLAAARGRFDIALVIASGTAGAMLGNIFWYLVARTIGIERMRPIVERYGRWLTMDWAEVEYAEKLFARHGWALMFFGRMIPTLRSLISVPAGFLKLRLSTFMIWSTLGTAIWTAALAIAGWMLGKRFLEIEHVVGPISNLVVALIVVVYLFRLFTWKPGARSGG